MAYTALKTFENGSTESADFEHYIEMVHWLAASPEAGITAWKSGYPIDQSALQEDVAAYC